MLVTIKQNKSMFLNVNLLISIRARINNILTHRQQEKCQCNGSNNWNKNKITSMCLKYYAFLQQHKIRGNETFFKSVKLYTNLLFFFVVQMQFVLLFKDK